LAYRVAADGAVLTRQSTTTRSVGQPYPGTQPFQRADHERFFGRAADAAVLAELWQANSLAVAVGPAASGKTSLLHAGVLPLIAGKRADVLPPGRISYGSTFPLAALPDHNPYTLALLKAWSPGEVTTRLVGLTVADFIRLRAERHDGIVLGLVDQAEDLLAVDGIRARYRERFLVELAEALQAEPRFHLLILVREEALGLFSGSLGSGARHSVTPLSRQGAVEAVTGPVSGTGRSYAADAAEKLITDLQTSRIVSAAGAERYVVDDRVQPALVQVVCTRLWNSLPRDLDVITPRDIRRFGDVDAALAKHCGSVIAAVADDHDMSATRLRSWLLQTFVITELGTGRREYEGQTHTATMANAVVRALEDRHLLSAEQDQSGTRWYKLLSDRLIEPLRQAADVLPPPIEPAEYLLGAERALTLGELDLAERYAKETLRTAAGTDLRLRAATESLRGNLRYEYEREKPAVAEACYRESAKLYEAVRDTGAVALQLAAVGQTLLAQGKFTKAVEELRAAADRIPNDLIVQTELALALWQLGQGRAAVAVLTDVLGIDGGNPEALRARGEILADLGDGRNALLDLNHVALNDRPATRAARGLALAELGDHSAAIEEIEDALDEAERNGPVLLYAARAAALRGDKAAAVDMAKRASDASDPPLPPQHRDVALRLIKSPDKRSELALHAVGHRELPEGLDAVI
jgi:tetratricopeptide (TPR) repeat protein